MNEQFGLEPIDPIIRAQLTRRSAGRVPDELMDEVTSALDSGRRLRTARWPSLAWTTPRLAGAGIAVAIVSILVFGVAMPASRPAATSGMPGLSLAAGYPAERALTTAELAAIPPPDGLPPEVSAGVVPRLVTVRTLYRSDRDRVIAVLFGAAAGNVFRGVPFIGLPGNPVSAFVGFEVFARPAIGRLAGTNTATRPKVKVRLAEAIESDGRESYLRAMVEERDGILSAKLTGHQGSGNLLSLVQANALLIVPAGVKSLAIGDQAEAWML